MTTVLHEPTRRFVLAQSWWIASEIVRRHPKLSIIETHPGGGQYDCLTVLGHTADGSESLVDLNRAGRIHVHRDSGFDPITWMSALTAQGGHDVVHRLEEAAALVAPAKAPPTGPRTLTYRVLARILASLVDDRHAWDARNGQIDSSGGDGGQRSELDRFPSVVEGLRDERPGDLFGVPAYCYWILLRGEEPVAVLDTDGCVHFTDRPSVELLPVHRSSGSSLTTTIGRVLGRLLP